ncbi:50S ribosomal protein L23 [Spectribacter hydrogenoxidans]|uniref:Large ribosomal subunit protein uL23 n=1 Tax=Spectribacter hydrogenoxidans TaxID=3075608 RepID=A0ABU3C432_9GAMM|nr:50S ribosomal protein L23 [Salinisphaera sp. W335]MDT0636141.1 50S ribosomal protein L23 [Salinisphaera sp. W335]
MNQERIYEVLRAPHVSEKSSVQADAHNQVVFQVAVDATKTEIKTAVERLFKVQVEGVTTLNVKGKTKRFRGQPGKRAAWKKAYVSLAAGQELDFLSGVE